MGNSYYFYRSITRWDKERKKRVGVSEYLVRSGNSGLVEKNRRSIYEFWNSQLFSSISSRIIFSLRKSCPDNPKKIIAMTMVRAMNLRRLKLLKSP